MQSTVFSRIASTFDFALEPGPSDRIWFPSGGPHDERLGYARIPVLSERLDSLGFDITDQARLTPALLRWIGRGAYPVHPDKGPVGLRVHATAGETLLDERFPLYAYQDFDSIPDLVRRTLVHIESGGMLDEGGPLRNPALEWDRLAIGALSLATRELGGERNVPGGSTLATQIEKYRHSPGGITASPGEKVRQMLNASLRAYGDGPVTYDQRRRIVTEYLNSVPLAGQAGFGEVTGLGEGLWAWYGTPFVQANAVLRRPPADELDRLEQASIFRQILSLLVAQRRPTFYLTRLEGHHALAALTDVYLTLLERDGVIPTWLAEQSRRVDPGAIRSSAPAWGRPGGVPRVKSASSVRTHLLDLTGVRGPYELDRLDLAAVASYDGRWDAAANELLAKMGDGEFLRKEGFMEEALLAAGDPAGVFYSVLLLERTALGTEVRIEADNFPGDMSLADGSRLELGSTAKLRTLTTYLEVIGEIYHRLEAVGVDSLGTLGSHGGDVLTSWVARELVRRPAAGLAHTLEAALDREYSASPHERFPTGGAELTFSNFDARFDEDLLSVREAFRQSVNLPFVRLMRDLVAYETAHLGTAELLSIDQDTWRQEYLVKFAEHEGAQYVRRFHRRYRDRAGHDVFTALLAGRGLSTTQLAWAVRAVAPDAPREIFADLVRTYGSDPTLSDERLIALYARTQPAGLPLSDLGFSSRVHPLELWVASERLSRPEETLQELLAASSSTLVEVYGWLLRTSRQHAQDVRIQTMLEIEAFQQIHARWRRLGYPFDDLAPSLGSAIGSSGDRPLALAELAGLILNDGVRLPVVRVEEIRLAEGTPFETRFRRRPESGERLLGPEVSAALKRALIDVVENGTGRRAQGALSDSAGGALALGGKTGTGDNRYLVHDARGRLIQSRIVNRTASFVFIAGDRYFGVVTAYVEGPSAEAYRFTSALPTQLLRVLGGRLGPLAASSATNAAGVRQEPRAFNPSPPLVRLSVAWLR
mgnify:CR=1 FL=1